MPLCLFSKRLNRVGYVIAGAFGIKSFQIFLAKGANARETWKFAHKLENDMASITREVFLSWNIMNPKVTRNVQHRGTDSGGAQDPR